MSEKAKGTLEELAREVEREGEETVTQEVEEGSLAALEEVKREEAPPTPLPSRGGRRR